MATSTAIKEIRFKGIPASPGISIGPAYIFHKHTPSVYVRSLDQTEIDKEIERLQKARERSQYELQKIFQFADQRLGPEQAKIFEAQLLLLEDDYLFTTIIDRIRKEKKNADFLVRDEIEKYYRIMTGAKDEYARERADDLQDVCNRILRNLEEQKLPSKLDGSYVIISHHLAAADALLFSRNDVLGYVTELGGATSHMALLARALKIPLVVGVHQISTIAQSNDVVIIDGSNGLVVLNPTQETLEYFEKQKADYEQFTQRLAKLRKEPAETLDERRVQLSANIELLEELDFVKQQGADGIGLYRTESFLLGREVFPSEDEQYENYNRIAEAMYPKQVIIRTFDIGGDKFMAQGVKENNPFLGWRGIRVMLDKPQIFLDQLRAILRASVKHNLAIMFPMVTSIKEVQLAKQLLAQAKDDLRQKGLPYDEKIQIGVMIEVPAAAAITDHLAKEVQFLSIGTNDLIQYLLAVDRGNEIVADLFQEFHPAVVRSLQYIIRRGKENQVWVGMCGQMAGNPLAAMLLIGLGLDEFSVVPTVLPEIKKIIRSIHYSEAQRIAEQALQMRSEDEIKTYLTTVMKQKFPDIPLS